MPSDDELRRVAEDVRALARSLSRDIRAAVDRARDDTYGPRSSAPHSDDGHGERRSAREDLAAAGRAARDELRAAQMAVRQSAREHRRHREDRRRAYGPGPGYPPRWDNWGRRSYRDAARQRPTGPPRPGYRAEDRPVAPTSPVPPPPVRHRHDGTTLAGLLAVVFGLAWLTAGTHLASVSTETVLAVALMVVGATTVVTARTDWALSGRAWPIVGGAAVAIGLLAISASPGLPVGFRHITFGGRTITPLAWTDVPGVIHGGVGTTTINLAALPTPLPAARALEVDNAAGQLAITVPDVPVRIDATIAAGRIVVNGVPAAGWHRAYSDTMNPTAPGPTLTLRIRSGFGKVDVQPPTSPSDGQPATKGLAGADGSLLSPKTPGGLESPPPTAETIPPAPTPTTVPGKAG